MTIRRSPADDSSCSPTHGSTLIFSAGHLKAADHPHAEPMRSRDGAGPDDRVSMFWRVFGGTIFTIAALVAISLYNNLNANINEVRSEINRLNEARAEFVKKEEFNSRTQNVWERIQQLQELRVTVGSLKEQMAAQADKAIDGKLVVDRLTSIEQRLKAAEDDQKALARHEAAILALEQKSALRESQLKALEEERKELSRQLVELRERLAKIEGVTEAKPGPKGLPAGPTQPGRSSGN